MELKLSEKFSKHIRPLSIEGVSGSVWGRTLFLQFLEDSESDKFAILGGDIILEKDGKMEYTYDNWSVSERVPTESFADFAQRGIKTAKDYLTRYPDKDGVLFAPVMTSEVTAGLTK